MKKIEKTCIISKDFYSIYLEDTRDSYTNKYALGNIGSIYISKDGVSMFPQLDADEKINNLKEKKIIETFIEIFGKEKFEPLSDKYYKIIKDKIESGELKKLGYLVKEEELDLEDSLDFISHRR